MLIKQSDGDALKQLLRTSSVSVALDYQHFTGSFRHTKRARVCPLALRCLPAHFLLGVLRNRAL